MSEMKAYQERNAARMSRQAVIKAMQHLTALKKVIRDLKPAKDNKNAIQESTIDGLKQERQSLIAERPVYQEAAWRLAAGQKVKERERGIFAIYDKLSKIYITLDLPPDPLPGSIKDEIDNGFTLITVPGNIILDGIPLKTGEQVWIKPHKGDKGDSGEPGYINLKPGDKAHMVDQKDSADYTATVAEFTTPKSKTNKLTTEQRRANGARGAAIRDESKRKKLALDARMFHVYAKRGKRVSRIGKQYGNMRGAFNFLRKYRESYPYDDYFVYDNKGQCWVYDSEIHNLRHNIDSSAI